MHWKISTEEREEWPHRVKESFWWLKENMRIEKAELRFDLLKYCTYIHHLDPDVDPTVHSFSIDKNCFKNIFKATIKFLKFFAKMSTLLIEFIKAILWLHPNISVSIRPLLDHPNYRETVTILNIRWPTKTIEYIFSDFTNSFWNLNHYQIGAQFKVLLVYGQPSTLEEVFDHFRVFSHEIGNFFLVQRSDIYKLTPRYLSLFPKHLHTLQFDLHYHAHTYRVMCT